MQFAINDDMLMNTIKMLKKYNNNFDLELFAAPSIHSHLLYMETISLVVGYVYLKSVVLQYVEGPLFSDYERGRVLLPQ